MRCEKITCKSALTGSGKHYRLNPYVGCQHACAYCYATFIARWKHVEGPWGSWVQVKTEIPSILQHELQRRKGIDVFLSTVCDVYQPVERRFRLTRHCLEVLRDASLLDHGLNVFLLTKSDLILRDKDVLSGFREGALEVAFSVTTHRDAMAKLFEPGASPPTRRFAAARELKRNGIAVGFLVNPILPYVTEKGMESILNTAERIGVDSVGFDKLNYASGHVGGKVRRLYQKLGARALRRFEEARSDSTYEKRLWAWVRKVTRGRRFRAKV
jgi:DNA repair photolyase